MTSVPSENGIHKLAACSIWVAAVTTVLLTACSQSADHHGILQSRRLLCFLGDTVYRFLQLLLLHTSANLRKMSMHWMPSSIPLAYLSTTDPANIVHILHETTVVTIFRIEFLLLLTHQRATDYATPASSSSSSSSLLRPRPPSSSPPPVRGQYSRDALHPIPAHSWCSESRWSFESPPTRWIGSLLWQSKHWPWETGFISFWWAEKSENNI